MAGTIAWPSSPPVLTSVGSPCRYRPPASRISPSISSGRATNHSFTAMVSPSELVMVPSSRQGCPARASPGIRLRSTTMSVVTSVCAFFLNALFGRRMAPRKSADRFRCSRNVGSALSSVPLEVMKTSNPPGRTFVSAAAKK